VSKRILVTGGAGFISSNFIHHLLAKTPYEVVSLDALTYAGNVDNLSGAMSHERLSFVQGDIRDADLVRDFLGMREFKYTGGIAEFIKHLNRGKATLHDKPIYMEADKDQVHIEIGLQYNDGYSESVFSFANNINTIDGGTHLSGFRTSLTRTINYAGQQSAYSAERSVQLVITAVLISRFDARVQGDGVQLSWNVETDENIRGYLVYRTTAGGNERPIMAAPLAATTASYTDTDVQGGTRYTYVLAALREDGTEVRSAPASATTPSIAFSIEPNAPNPFRDSTRIPFTLDAASHVNVRVYDVTGALIATLFDGSMSEGRHEVGWGGHNAAGNLVATGAYFCTLTAGKRMLSMKMLLVR
jgi:hypothetical protein